MFLSDGRRQIGASIEGEEIILAGNQEEEIVLGVVEETGKGLDISDRKPCKFGILNET